MIALRFHTGTYHTNQKLTREKWFLQISLRQIDSQTLPVGVWGVTDFGHGATGVQLW